MTPEFKADVIKLICDANDRGVKEGLLALRDSVNLMAEQVPQSMFSYRDFAQFIEMAIEKLSKTDKSGG